MILQCGSAEEGSGGTVILEAHVLESFSPTDPTSALWATTTGSRLVAPFAW
jgi:hypothetical protein